VFSGEAEATIARARADALSVALLAKALSRNVGLHLHVFTSNKHGILFS